jgi:hypothetical protein
MTVVDLKSISFYKKGNEKFVGYLTTQTGLKLSIEGFLHLLKAKTVNASGRKIVLPSTSDTILPCYNISDVYFY